MEIMKKFLLILVATLSISAVSAQKWSVGGRVGSGFQAVAQYELNSANFIEARFGASWLNTAGDVTADFTVLYNWHVMEMDWTPSKGIWFFDAGVGLNVGGKQHYAYIGATGMARLGIRFNDIPLSLAFDWSPSFGPGIAYAGDLNSTDFNEYGLANMGISCTYTF